METQERRRFKGDRQPGKPTRLNPQRTEAGNDSIQHAEVWGASARSVENQQFMFDENGLRNNGSHTARPNEPQNYCDHMG